jgi:hypothetical protein
MRDAPEMGQARRPFIRTAKTDKINNSEERKEVWRSGIVSLTAAGLRHNRAPRSNLQIIQFNPVAATRLTSEAFLLCARFGRSID